VRARSLRLAVPAALLALAEGAETQCPAPSTPASPLQAAIDAAQPGDVIVIGPGGPSTNGVPVCVTKPLTFLGADPTGPVPVSAVPPPGTPGSLWGVFNVTSAVSGVVLFHNLSIGGPCSSLAPLALRGIDVEAPNATLVVDECVVVGSHWTDLCNTGDGGPGATGIEGTLARLVVRDSTVFGGSSAFPFLGGPGDDGGDAIHVTGEVLLVRATLVGGNASSSLGVVAPGGGCMLFPPGNGGDAIDATSLLVWGSTGAGGAPGLQLDCAALATGQGIPGSGIGNPGPVLLTVGPAPTLGGTATFVLNNPAALPAGIYASLVGWGPTTNLPGLGFYFLGPSPALLASSAGLTGLSIPVPTDPVLLGASIPVQAHVGAQITNPDLVTIVP